MTQAKQLEQAIDGFRDSCQDEMDFLFDSLLHSLAVASKNAKAQSFERANPSLRHAIMLSGRLRQNLKALPIPSLHGHVDDLFDYFSEVLSEAFKLPFVEDIDELKLLTSELRKGIRTLLEPTNKSLHVTIASSQSGSALPSSKPLH
jgi:flagellin-specific chaperone FliS